MYTQYTALFSYEFALIFIYLVASLMHLFNLITSYTQPCRGERAVVGALGVENP